MPLFRFLLLLCLAWLSTALLGTAATIPTARANYVLVAKGNCYILNANTGELIPAGSFQKVGRLAVVPRIKSATTNGANIRDFALQVDHGLAGGRGAFQVATNTFLNGLLGGSSQSPGRDLAVVTANANLTTLTVALDPQMALQTARNILKITNGQENAYQIIAGRLTIYFLANGRVSGQVVLQAQGFHQPGQVALTSSFSGYRTAKW